MPFAPRATPLNLSWLRLSCVVIVLVTLATPRPAFAARTVDELLARASAEATALLSGPEHDNKAARQIAARIRGLTGR